MVKKEKTGIGATLPVRTASTQDRQDASLDAIERIKISLQRVGNSPAIPTDPMQEERARALAALNPTNPQQEPPSAQSSTYQHGKGIIHELLKQQPKQQKGPFVSREAKYRLSLLELDKLHNGDPVFGYARGLAEGDILEMTLNAKQVEKIVGQLKKRGLEKNALAAALLHGLDMMFNDAIKSALSTPYSRGTYSWCMTRSLPPTKILESELRFDPRWSNMAGDTYMSYEFKGPECRLKFDEVHSASLRAQSQLSNTGIVPEEASLSIDDRCILDDGTVAKTYIIRQMVPVPDLSQKNKAMPFCKYYLADTNKTDLMIREELVRTIIDIAHRVYNDTYQKMIKS